MKKLLVIGVLVGMMSSLGAATSNFKRVVSKAQHNFWYTNNFGAAAKELFPVLAPEAMDEDAYHIGLAREDVDFLLSGRFRQEGFLFDKALTLRDDFNDKYGFNRTKVNIDISTQYGRRNYGLPAAQMHARLTAFPVWDAETTYTPILPQKIYLNGTNYLKRAEIGEHDHEGPVPLMYLEEGWIKVNFDTFVSRLKNEVSLQVGFFPFMVGRGVSLGDYPFTGVEFLGWERKGDIGNATQRSPGVLLHVGLGRYNDAALEVYYSQSRNRMLGPDWTREPVKSRHLDLKRSTNPEDIQRGAWANQSILAVRGNCSLELGTRNPSRLYWEPYFVHVSAPELKVEFEADASADLWTVGSMSEWTRGNWSVNFEMAGQFGTHTMHAIDRNQIIVDDAYYMETSANFDGDGDTIIPTATGVAGRLDERMGMPAKFNSHVLIGIKPNVNDPSEYSPYPAYYVSDEMQHINGSRGLEHQGGTVRVGPDVSKNDLVPGDEYVSKKFNWADVDNGLNIPDGGLYGAYKFKTGIDYFDDKFTVLGSKASSILHNADIPFAGLRRFRPKYELSCSSVMALLDVCYTLPSKRAKFAAALGYIGGDKYPFNTEEDKSYKGFIPMRDANYTGRWVTSFVMLYPRKMPRPTDMADTNLYAHKNYQTMQNLKYVGLNATWLPLPRKDNLSLEVNALYFWEVSPPSKWDINATRQFKDTQTSGGFGKETSLYQFLQNDELHFSGAATIEDASSCLGAELNGVIKWQPFEGCEFATRFGAFFPGQLYKDVHGCPSMNAIRAHNNVDGDLEYSYLGSNTVTGGMLRVTYKF